MSSDQLEKYKVFKTLHERPGAFIIPNPWDAGTARILTAIGFEALATTSAGLAFAIGKRSSARSLTRDDVIENARAIVEATHLPVSADLEEGFGPSPDTCAETISLAAGVGLVGGSIEDATGDPEQLLFDFNHAVERVAAAAEAARDLPLLLTARAENFIRRNPDLDDTIRRLQAYEEAGADVLYAPGLPSLDAIREVCTALTKPVNVVVGLTGPNFTAYELEKAGVRRISVGGALARAALAGLVNAATEMKFEGTFTFTQTAMSHSEAMSYMQATTRA